VFTKLYLCLRGTWLYSFAMLLMLLTLLTGLCLPEFVYRIVLSATWFVNLNPNLIV
jgi:hypothetical protein